MPPDATDQKPLAVARFEETRWSIVVAAGGNSTRAGQALADLGEEMARAGKAAQFDALKCCLTGERAAAYSEIARRMGTTEGALKVAIHRLRDRFRQLLREEMANTVGSAAEVEEELRQLFSALSM